jgi:hypothetical protein
MNIQAGLPLNVDVFHIPGGVFQCYPGRARPVIAYAEGQVLVETIESESFLMGLKYR